MTEAPILILEDEALIAMDVAATLEDAGHVPVVICNTLPQARTFLDAQAPRLAILDVNLGKGQTSFEIALALAARDVPIIMVSGYSEATVELPPGLEGATRLSKPFVIEDLLRATAKATT